MYGTQINVIIIWLGQFAGPDMHIRILIGWFTGHSFPVLDQQI